MIDCIFLGLQGQRDKQLRCKWPHHTLLNFEDDEYYPETCLLKFGVATYTAQVMTWTLKRCRNSWAPPAHQAWIWYWYYQSACPEGSASQGTPGAWASKCHNPHLSSVPPVLPPPPALRQPSGFAISPGSKGPSTKTCSVPHGRKVGHASNSQLCASTLPAVFLAALCL